MKKLLSLLTLVVSCTSGLSAEGRVSMDISFRGQDNLWAEDLFVTRKHRGADYFDIFAPNTGFISLHEESGKAQRSKEEELYSREAIRWGVLGYQATIKSGWYMGVTPSVGVRPHQTDRSEVQFTFDPGLVVGKQFTHGALLAKAEAFYHNGVGMRSAFQYPVVVTKYGSVAANHTVGFGLYPQRTTLFPMRPHNIAQRYACDLFNGVRFWRGRASMGLGYHCGIERQISLTPFAREWNTVQTRSIDQHNEKPSKKHHTLRGENMPRIAVVHDVIGDLTFAWEHLRLSMHTKMNLTEQRGSSVGLRVSYHF